MEARSRSSALNPLAPGVTSTALAGRALALAAGLAVIGGFTIAAGPAQAQDRSVSSDVHTIQVAEDERPFFENWPDSLLDPDAFDGEALSDEARRAVEQLLAAVEPMMAQLSLLIRDLPRYEAPVILPNGDILIRRIQPPETGELGEDRGDEGLNSDGSLDL